MGRVAARRRCDLLILPTSLLTNTNGQDCMDTHHNPLPSLTWDIVADAFSLLHPSQQPTALHRSLLDAAYLLSHASYLALLLPNEHFLAVVASKGQSHSQSHQPPLSPEAASLCKDTLQQHFESSQNHSLPNQQLPPSHTTCLPFITPQGPGGLYIERPLSSQPLSTKHTKALCKLLEHAKSSLSIVYTSVNLRQFAHKLHHQQKLESIETLAGGVAHEINNPIQGILGYTELLQVHAPQDEKIQRYTEAIIDETNRVTNTVYALLHFAQNDNNACQLTKVSELIQSAFRLLQTILRHDHIQVAFDIQPKLPPVQCNFNQMQQVIMNLVNNARYALNLRFPRHDEHKKLKVLARETNENTIRITIQDYGTGIPEHIQERIFDPFFTTKERTHSTGLGLSVSHGIIRDHSGSLTVESQINEGTQVHIDLPPYKDT